MQTMTYRLTLVKRPVIKATAANASDKIGKEALV